MKDVDLLIPQWINAAELQQNEDGSVMPWRLPMDCLPLLEDRSRFQAGNPSGVRLRFSTDATRIELNVEAVPPGTSGTKGTRWFDLTCDNRLLGRVQLEIGDSLVAFDELPAGNKTLELWLNHMYCPVIVQSLRINEGAAVTVPEPDSRQRILFYGSSISHGRKADGPSESWPIFAAHMAGLNPINLGIGGACTLETTVAQHLRDTPADYLSFCLGVNVVAGITHSPRTFRSAVVGLLQLVREKHPTTPLAVQSGIYLDGPLENTPNILGMDMASSRKQVEEVVNLFIERGDQHLMYTDGLELFGPDDASLLFDGVHPDGEGHRLLAKRYHETVWPKLSVL